jgi:hypothetical protein
MQDLESQLKDLKTELKAAETEEQLISSVKFQIILLILWNSD